MVSEEPRETLTIAQLAERAGVTRRTIHYYVAQGLLPPPAGGGREWLYSTEHLTRLRAIRQFKEAFLPLAEIRRRLTRLSPTEITRLADAPSTTSALDHLAAVMSAVRARRGPPGGAVGPTARARLVASLAADSEPPATDTPPGEAWYHVTLAPKVELRYQLTGDRRRDAAVLHIIRRAMSFLATIAAKGPG
jgi:DNA-binding transcriptional MerR regulator